MSSVIEVEGLRLRFPGCEALKEVNLRVEASSICALLGENGVGKTTLIRVLTGYLIPTAGRCQVLGLDPVTQTDELRRRIGYVADPPVLYGWMQVSEIGWFASAFMRQVIWGVIENWLHDLSCRLTARSAT